MNVLKKFDAVAVEFHDHSPLAQEGILDIAIDILEWNQNPRNNFFPIFMGGARYFRLLHHAARKMLWQKLLSICIERTALSVLYFRQAAHIPKQLY